MSWRGSRKSRSCSRLTNQFVFNFLKIAVRSETPGDFCEAQRRDQRNQSGVSGPKRSEESGRKEAFRRSVRIEGAQRSGQGNRSGPKGSEGPERNRGIGAEKGSEESVNTGLN